MNIAILNESKQGIGGGWSFIDNLKKGLEGKATITDWKHAHICLIPSSSMISKETFRDVKAAGKKVVLRVDNIPRNSRNRGSGTTRLYEMGQQANAIVYQSEWSWEYVGQFIKRAGPVIYNGIDTKIFNPTGDRYVFQNPTYIYSRYNRDETKRWEEVHYEYQMIQRENPKAKLIIIGRFSDELRQYNFDFFNGENVEYLGVIEDKCLLAKMLRGCHYMLATYYNDCYSNTYLEALMCGVELHKPSMTGGTPELIENAKKGLEFNSCERMADDYLKFFKTLI